MCAFLSIPVCINVCMLLLVCVCVLRDTWKKNLARLLEPNTSICYHGYHVNVIIIIVHKYINNIIVIVVNNILFGCICVIMLFFFKKRYKRFMFCTIAALSVQISSN